MAYCFIFVTMLCILLIPGKISKETPTEGSGSFIKNKFLFLVKNSFFSRNNVFQTKTDGGTPTL